MELIENRSCDIFTPEKISEKMISFLKNKGTLLEPSVGEGDLIKNIDYSKYKRIDVYDIKKEYLNKIINKNNLKKYNTDFLKSKKKQYNNIILNPPFIKIQNLPDGYREFIKKEFPILNGNVDIYYAFLIKCVENLAEDGVMVSITPNSYLYTKSAKTMREHFIKSKLIKEIIDFGHEQVFENVSTYCCITVFTKENKDTLLYNGKTINYENMDNFIHKEKEECNEIFKKLKDVCTVKNGIATLKDKVFIHNTKLYEETCWRKLYKNNKCVWCIYPYTNDGKIIEEDVLSKECPNTYNYLVTRREELNKREKGKGKYVKWYAYGRTQSLKVSDKSYVLYIPSMIDPKSPNISIKKPELHIGSICIEPKGDTYTCDKIKEIIIDNIDKIENSSSKRNNGYVQISTTVLKDLIIN